MPISPLPDSSFRDIDLGSIGIPGEVSIERELHSEWGQRDDAYWLDAVGSLFASNGSTADVGIRPGEGVILSCAVLRGSHYSVVLWSVIA